MNNRQIGFLHPGEMGISLAVTAQHSGQHACWVSGGRSQSTRDRAEKYQLEDTENLPQMCGRCTVIFSVCPPHAAEAVAKAVMACGFTGIYVDANAISPQRSINIGNAMSAAGITFVDGGIIGPPGMEARYYLAVPVRGISTPGG
jgi:3-hydroxyisobutyrate dehydrogenase-like beta-hydroxyacid dehydrogenase